MAAFQSESPYTVFHKDKLTLHPDPLFLPKIVSGFYLSYPMVLLVFFQALADDSQHAPHCLNVHQTFYLDHNSAFQQDVPLFISYSGPN